MLTGRWAVHRLLNVLGKLRRRDEELRPQVKRADWTALDQATSRGDAEPWLAPADRRSGSGSQAGRLGWGRTCPRCACISRMCRGWVSDCARPILLERSLEEVRHRTRVIGRFPLWRVLLEPVLGGTRPGARWSPGPQND